LNTANRKSQTAKRRRGLSMLEMVLALPILLFVMALMINFGTVASWKIRGLSVSRHAAWGSRWGRSGLRYRRPQYWPATAHIGVGGGSVPELDDPRIDHPVARGPLPYGTTVRSELLDPSRGLRQGSAGMTREFPLLGTMEPFHLDAKTRMLDNKWQYQRMGLPGNWQRRIPVIYDLAKTPEFVEPYVSAVMDIFNTPVRPQLAPLDRDDEFIRYWHSAPDFHPRLSQFCSLDPAHAAGSVENLIDRIRGKVERDADGNVILRIPSVAEVMTRSFLNLYRSVIQQYQNLIDADPPPPPDEVAAMRAEIAQLEAKVEILEQFLARLQSQSGNSS